jgi:hypothetical protein
VDDAVRSSLREDRASVIWYYSCSPSHWKSLIWLSYSPMWVYEILDNLHEENDMARRPPSVVQLAWKEKHRPRFFLTITLIYFSSDGPQWRLYFFPYRPPIPMSRYCVGDLASHVQIQCLTWLSEVSSEEAINLLYNWLHWRFWLEEYSNASCPYRLDLERWWLLPVSHIRRGETLSAELLQHLCSRLTISIY